MLETLDLSLKLPPDAARAERAALGPELARLQRAAYESGVPAVFLFEGVDESGKGDALAHLVEWLDPRGFRVHALREPGEEEALRPALWRWWVRLPARNAFAMFDRSWHDDLVQGRLDRRLDAAAWERGLAQAREFERQLTDDGVVLVKLWLHVGRDEQKRRRKAWAKDPHQRWRAKASRERHAYGWRETIAVVEDLLARTHTANAPWVLVEAEDDHHRRVKVMREAAAALRRGLAARGVELPGPDADLRPPAARAGGDVPHPDTLPAGFAVPADSPLARVDVGVRLAKPDYQRELPALQERLRELHFAGYARRRAAAVVFEGWDAAGKGSAIKRLTEQLDPRGYAVIPVSAPSAEEKARHYLWRFWREVPKAGHLAVFDRSWYGRVLVERVEGFAEEPAWRRAYQEINEFERELVGAGIVLVKFWLHVSPEEQLRRFRAREATPAKRHKIGPEDWRNRARWPQYVGAVGDLLRQTSTPEAPWTVVEADDKPWARVKVLRSVVAALERALGAGGSAP